MTVSVGRNFPADMYVIAISAGGGCEVDMSGVTGDSEKVQLAVGPGRGQTQQARRKPLERRSLSRTTKPRARDSRGESFDSISQTDKAAAQLP